MQTQIKITGDGKQAIEELKQVASALEKVESAAAPAAAAATAGLTETNDQAQSTSKSIEELQEEFDKLADSGAGIEDLTQRLDGLEKAAKKLGRDLSALVTAPFVALAGISLKNIFDQGALAGSTGVFRQLNLAVEGLKKNFSELTEDLGKQLTPAIIKAIGVLNTLIASYQALSTETKGFIGTFTTILAVIGPLILAFSTVSGVIVKLAPVIGAIVTEVGLFVAGLGPLVQAFVSVKGAILLAVPVVLGLINVFYQLRKSGVDTVTALSKTFDLFVTGFNNYVTKNILRAIGGIVSGFEFLAKKVGISGSTAGSQFIDSMVATLDEKFTASKNDVDAILATIGSSAGNAFTFGLSGALEGAANALKTAAGNVDLSGVNAAEREAMLKDDYEYYQKLSALMAQQAAELVQRSEAIRSTISSNLTDGLLDFAEGSKDAGQAFADFAKQTVRALLQIATQAAIMNALFPPGSPLGNLIGSFAAATSVKGFATGGLVTGPGSGTSDSIIARLSNGEFVNDAKTVSHFGVGFFENLKSMARGGVPISPRGAHPGFADGGSISPGQGAAPQVILENRGTGKEVVSQSYDPKTAITTVIIEDLGKNGPVAKAMQNTFGFRRGGFT